MKPVRRLFPATLAVLLMSSSAALHAQYEHPQGPPPQGYQQGGGGGWDGPPQEFNDAQRRGFHDGMDGARKDYENHRRPDVNNRDEFRHPDVPRPMRHDYRMGFRRGYEVAMHHMMGGGPGGPR